MKPSRKLPQTQQLRLPPLPVTPLPPTPLTLLTLSLTPLSQLPLPRFPPLPLILLLTLPLTPLQPLPLTQLPSALKERGEEENIRSRKKVGHSLDGPISALRPQFQYLAKKSSLLLFYYRMDRRMDGRTDGQIPPAFYRTSFLSGTLPCSPST